MEIMLRLGGVLFRFRAERDMIVGPELLPFIVAGEEKADITVEISWDWEHAVLPSGEMVGQDVILNYYDEGSVRCCITRGGPKGPVACTCYSPDFRRVVCTINEKPFLMPPKALGSVLRMLPMREIFLHFGTLFLHASQIAYLGRGVLFTAPAGTGKTTQAKLWQKYRSAEIVCNDRTLTRRVDGIWRTYGYPVDGSEPVRSNRVTTLGAVILLEQGRENTVRRLAASKAMPRLMRQVVLDCWSGAARTAAMELLITLMEEIPVYLLTCTPDERAVETLEAKLTEDGVILHGKNFRPSLE